MKTGVLFTAFFSLAVATAGGCASSHPIESWQQRLTNYTLHEGGGDLNVLRESAELRSTDDPRPAQIRFDDTDIASRGLPPFVDRHDAHGLMVGQHTEAGSPVFFFLVGVVQRPFSGDSQVEDIRLVSCTVRHGRHHWKTSPPDADALEAYRNSSQGPDRANPSAGSRVFPLVDDHFEFEISGRTARARDARSQATWELPLD